MERRRFTIFDGMVLVAATAVGLTAALPFHRAIAELGLGIMPRLYLFAASPSLSTWSIALLVIKMRGKREKFRRFARQPGIAACLMSFVGISLAIARVTIRVAIPSFASDQSPVLMFSGTAPIIIAPIIAASWATLVMTGMWRPEKDWIGMMGRVLAFCWFGLFLVGASLYLIS